MIKLNPKIVEYLSEKLSKSKATVRKNISLLRRDYASCTLNAVAQIYARQYGLSVLQKLNNDDKKTLPNIKLKRDTTTITRKPIHKKQKILKFIQYDSNDYFINAHIQEINRAYTKACFTSVNILVRKVIENLIIDILRKKFPPNTKTNKELYYDTSKRRFKDFSIILKNLYEMRNRFTLDDKKVVERLCEKAKSIKEDANDKAHSWFYIVKYRKEIDDLDVQTIVELIVRLERSVGLR